MGLAWFLRAIGLGRGGYYQSLGLRKSWYFQRQPVITQGEFHLKGDLLD